MIKDTAVQILLEHFSEGMVRTIIDALVEDEREECAKLCENSYEYGGSNLADAIRLRGQQ